MLALLFANAPTVSGELIDHGVEILRADPTLDSAVTVSRYNMWSPLRARRLTEEGRSSRSSRSKRSAIRPR